MEPGIRYTGRYFDDPLGTMTVEETTIIEGQGVQNFSNRFGDYSHLTMDPDDFTFWHTAEYFSANNQWRTQVASFSLSSGFAQDVGVNNIINPTNGIFTIELEANKKYDVTVNNAIGQTVILTTIRGMNTTIDLSNFGKGVYTVELKNNSSTYVEKVIVE